MTSGISTFDLGDPNVSIAKILLQPDGKIVIISTVLGNFGAIRLNRFGQVDSSFGVNGRMTVDIGGNDVALSGIVQPDGKIIIAGSFNWGTTSSDLALVRLLTSGVVDQSFGVNGKIVVDFAQYDTADTVAIRPDGKILVGGHTYYQGNDDFIAMLLTSTGIVDSNFGSSGVFNVDLGSRDMGYSIISLSDGSFLLAGESGWGVGIVKYTPNGMPDSSFGQAGKVILSNFFHSDVIKIASLSDGKLIVATDYNSGVSRDLAVIRLNPNGTVDTAFGSQGTASLDIQGLSDQLADMLVTADNKILLIATSGGDFSSIRLNTDGSIDTNFGTNGRVVTDIGSPNDIAKSAVLQSNGILVVAGTSNGSIATVSYAANGVLNQSFGVPESGGSSNSATSNNSPPVCFAKGTRINLRTSSILVEAIQQNHELLSPNQPSQVKWIGYQRRTPEFAQFQDYLPVKISAGALDDHVPLRDLYLSPDHAVLVDGHLVHAKALVNGKTIVQMTQWAGDIEYYHIETEAHEIIFAEGVPCETFIDNVSREQFDNYAEYQALYPNTRMMKELPLPRVKFKRQLPTMIKQRLESRITELDRQHKV